MGKSERVGCFPSRESLELLDRAGIELLRALRPGPEAERRRGRPHHVNRRIYTEKLWALDRALNPRRVPLNRPNPDRTSARGWPVEVREGIGRLDAIAIALMNRWGLRWLSVAETIEDLWSQGFDDDPEAEEGVSDRWPGLRGRFEWVESTGPDEGDPPPDLRRMEVPPDAPWVPSPEELDGIEDALELIRAGSGQDGYPQPDPSSQADDRIPGIETEDEIPEAGPQQGRDHPGKRWTMAEMAEELGAALKAMPKPPKPMNPGRIKVSCSDGTGAYADLSTARSWAGDPGFDHFYEKLWSTRLFRTRAGRYIKSTEWDFSGTAWGAEDLPPPDTFEVITLEEAAEWFVESYHPPSGDDDEPMPAEISDYLARMDIDRRPAQAATATAPGALGTAPMSSGVSTKEPPASPSAPERMAAELARQKKAIPAALIRFMAERDSATYQEIVHIVHGAEKLSDGAIRANVKRTNEELAAMAADFRFECGGGMVHKKRHGRDGA